MYFRFRYTIIQKLSSNNINMKAAGEQFNYLLIMATQHWRNGLQV